MSFVARRVYGEPGTLYSRCGGIFGMAAFADRCMDLWMNDKTLNDNAAVARWHESAQRPGFKFLVVGRMPLEHRAAVTWHTSATISASPPAQTQPFGTPRPPSPTPPPPPYALQVQIVCSLTGGPQ
eukprot:4834404-Prymnesium_polylepis.1